MKEGSGHLGKMVLVGFVGFLAVGGILFLANSSDRGDLLQGNLDLKKSAEESKPAYDLQFLPGSIVLDPEVARIGQILNVKATVINAGDEDIIDSFGVNVRLDNAEINKLSINGLAAGQQQDIYVEFVLDKNIPWRSKAALSAEIDPENIIQESDEVNNLAQKVVEIEQ